MPLHAFIEYLKYNWKAKGRHGTHSPFVYDLIDHVLLDKSPLKKQYLVKCPGLDLKYENLLCRIAAYYNYRDIVSLAATNTIRCKADMLLINSDPSTWAAILNEHRDLLENESVAVITGIHETAAHSTAWEKFTADTNVRMSIDLYGIGLLFFKEEFKEKQHFVLKY
jgi:hypothetical protein